jgi:hypothetical protein
MILFMRTKEEWQAVVDDIREVLRKHHVSIHGSCVSEGVYGEILLLDADKMLPSNAVKELCPGHFFVESVGA